MYIYLYRTLDGAASVVWHAAEGQGRALPRRILLSFAPSAAAVWHCDRVRITYERNSVRHSVFFKRWAGQFVCFAFASLLLGLHVPSWSILRDAVMSPITCYPRRTPVLPSVVTIFERSKNRTWKLIFIVAHFLYVFTVKRAVMLPKPDRETIFEI